MNEPPARGPWTYLLRYKRPIAGGVVMLLLTNALFLGIPWTIGRTIQAFDGWILDGATRQFVADPHPEQVAWLALEMAAFAIGTALTRIWSRIWIFNAARAGEYDLRSDLFRHLLSLDQPYYRAHPTGDVMSRLTNDVQTVRAMWGAGVLQLLNTAFAFAFVLTVMVRIDPWLTLLACIPYPTIVLVGRVFGKRIYKGSIAVQAQLGALSNEIQEDLTAIAAIKTYGLEPTRRERFRASSEKLLAANMTLTRTRGQLGPAFIALGSLSTIIVLYAGGVRHLSAPHLMEMIGYLARLVWPTLALGWMMSLLQRGRASWNRVATLLDTQPAIKDGPGPGLPAAERQGGLELRGLSVELGGRKVLDDVSFTVPAGTFTAIVGRTGSGKTTLVEAVCRLIDIPAGAVFLDGRDVTALPLGDLRAAIGYAPQEAFLFSTTIADNIAMGFGAGTALPRARADELEKIGAGSHAVTASAFDGDAPVPTITRAAEAAGLSRDLDAMPEHYATIVGERGITLSGGQRQRVALARAIASDPRLLILDDSLSSVDAGTERVILARLAEVLHGRTALLISHRVAAVENAHQIVVLDDGKVAEKGTHRELLALGGVYAELYRTQLETQQLAREAS